MRLNWVFENVENAIRVESYSGKENNFLKFLETLLPEKTEIMKIKVEKNRYNAIIFSKDTDIEKVKIGFFGHLDTIPAISKELLVPKTNKKFIAGLGACDMKSAIIVYLYLLRKNSLKDVAIFLTVDEENEMKGIKKFVEIKQRKFGNLKVAILGEPTNLKIGIGHMGVIHSEIEIRGKASHASLPEKGVNAIEKAAEFIINFKRKYILTKGKVGMEKFSFTKIEGGKALNVIPDTCKLYTDIRIPENFDINKLNIIEQLGAKHTISSILPPYLMEEKLQRLVKKFGKTIILPYATEAGFLKSCGIETIIFGPGDWKVAHTINEKIEKAKLSGYASLLPKLLKLLQNY